MYVGIGPVFVCVCLSVWVFESYVVHHVVNTGLQLGKPLMQQYGVYDMHLV